MLQFARVRSHPDGSGQDLTQRFNFIPTEACRAGVPQRAPLELHPPFLFWPIKNPILCLLFAPLFIILYIWTTLYNTPSPYQHIPQRGYNGAFYPGFSPSLYPAKSVVQKCPPRFVGHICHPPSTKTTPLLNFAHCPPTELTPRQVL